MSNAIWMITYELRRKREAAYLEWFHEVHVPEKLARPGYSWASHCRATNADTDDGAPHYLALFGGETTSVFFNPSPAQLAPKQPAETRDMMACRVSSRALILTGEWVAADDGAPSAGGGPVDAEAISLTLCDAAGNDMDFGAWLIQEHLPLVAGNTIHKLLASSGDVRHAIIHARNADAAPPRSFADATDGEWSAKVASYLNHPLDRSLIAMRRIFP
jgi:hypothetical protein